jgi:hypothetical protein
MAIVPLPLSPNAAARALLHHLLELPGLEPAPEALTEPRPSPKIYLTLRACMCDECGTGGAPHRPLEGAINAINDSTLG